MDVDSGVSANVRQEFEAGSDQWIVVYVPPDMGIELDPAGIYAEVADDAAKRAEDGQRIVSMHTMPLRHSGVFMGRDGSGYETRAAVVVVYARHA